MRVRGHLFDRIHCAQRVGDVSQSYQSGPLIEQRCVLVEKELASVVAWHDAKPAALLVAQHLPGDDVGMVFQLRQDDLVTVPEESAREAMHYQIDRIRRAAR